jgi:hypothetical protein
MGTIAQQRPAMTARTAILVSADVAFRRRVREALTDLRWQVREAAGGAESAAERGAARTAEGAGRGWRDLE